MGFDNDAPNFTIIEDKAYTEDNVLVYNIFVFNIPHKTTDLELRGYFQRFGELSRVCVRRGIHSRRHAPRVGFVNFVDCKIAAKVLHLPFHYLNGRRIGVKACDSWHQPGVDKFQYQTTTERDRGTFQKSKGRKNVTSEEASVTTVDDNEEEECVVVDIQTAPIFHLNDDCLEIICQQLELRDQLHFARTCQRFRNVFIMCGKREYKHLKVDNLETLTLWEIRDMLQMVGNFIESLEGSIPRKESKRIIEFIGLFCTRVVSLHLATSKFNAPTIKKLFQKMRSVTSLQLHEANLNDNAVQHLRGLKSLKLLHITENYEMTGRFLDSLESLEELSLRGCGNIQPTYFCAMCRKLKNLRVLDIQRCGRLNKLSVEIMVRYCPTIEAISLSTNYLGLECIAKLPKLTHLDVLAETLLNSPIFNLLVTNLGNQLQCLKLKTCDGIGYNDIALISQMENLRILACPNNTQIDDRCLKKLGSLKKLEEINLKNCKMFTRDGLLWLLRNCKQLRRINIVQCTQLKEDLVHNFITTILQKEETVPKVPSLILAGRSGISRQILEDATYKANLDRINISIDVPFANYDFTDDVEDIYDIITESDFEDLDDDEISDSENDMFYMDHFMSDDSDDDQIFFHSEDDPYFDFFYGNGEDFF